MSSSRLRFVLKIYSKKLQDQSFKTLLCAFGKLRFFKYLLLAGETKRLSFEGYDVFRPKTFLPTDIWSTTVPRLFSPQSFGRQAFGRQAFGQQAFGRQEFGQLAFGLQAFD
jgi:hypothetical protein